MKKESSNVYTFSQSCECQVLSDYDQHFKARPKDFNCMPPFRSAVAKFASSLYLEMHNLDEDEENQHHDAMPFGDILDKFIKNVFSAADSMAQDIAVSGCLYYHLNEHDK